MEEPIEHHNSAEKDVESFPSDHKNIIIYYALTYISLTYPYIVKITPLYFKINSCKNTNKPNCFL